MIGRTIGKYRIVGQLGRGGAGVVYKAVDETLHRDVAIKTLNPDLGDTEVMNRFRAEATILARLNHPQIATIFELFRDEAELLMVMEFVRGEALDKLSERLGALSPERAAYIIDHVLSALEHAHRAGVVHRDIKPANVMVTDEGGIKIMDFGIARVLGADQKTVDFRLMGTPAYMSPEQVMGEEVDGRSDLYSVGVLFYRLLTGALPFAADTALGMLQRQIRDTPIPMQAHRAGLPDWCERIVHRALAKVPADRFQSAEEFRDALARATGPLPMADLARTFAAGQEALVPAQPINQTIDLSRHSAALPAAARISHAAAAAAQPRSRFSWAQAAVMALVALGAAGVGYLSLYDPGTASVTTAAELPDAPAPAAPVLEPVESQPPALIEADLAPVVAPDPPAPPPVPAAPARRSVTAPAPAPVAEVAPPPSSPPAASEPVDVVERRPVRITVDHEPSLVFETRALVGTRKPREQGAQLVLGEGRITVIPQEDPTTPLCSFPYGRVLSINVSRNRDPLWNSPQGPAPVARAGGALSRLGFQSPRHWIALRTSTEEQFVAIRFDEVLLKRVLLALEERTGRRAEFIELPKEKDDDR
jgi:serine/threonine-protein kinase